MEKLIKRGILIVVSMVLIATLSTCKSSDQEKSTVSIDISALKENLFIAESSSQSDSVNRSESQASASDTSNDAQDAVVTLMIAPLTFVNHGKKYRVEDFGEATETDLENDAVNSIDFLQFVQLSGSSSTVEIEVPTISSGWQLIAVVTNVAIADVEDFKSDENDGAMKYIGFTDESFTSASDFESANPTLTLQRYCDQGEENRPKGCATFDGGVPAKAIVTAAVEIHGVSINGVSQTPSTPFPWIVRATPNSNQLSAAAAATALQGIYNSYGSTVESITVTATHQLSLGKSTACRALDHESTTTAFDTACGFQTYSRYY
ncbi:hypothetical protein KJ966_16060 [bacterium]|nr:hypothetical protein [bacterium]